MPKHFSIVPLAQAAILFFTSYPTAAGGVEPTLQGRITDSKGRPLAGAEIWVAHDLSIFNHSWSREPQARTGKDGRFVLQDLGTSRGTVTLQICAEGYLPEGFEFKEIRPEPLEVKLQPAARILGRVTNAQGQPVEGATFETEYSGKGPDCFSIPPPSSWGDEGETTSNAQGLFTLKPLGSGWFDVTAWADGYVSSERKRVHLAPGQALEGVTLVVGRGGTLTGKVVDPKGAPIQGAKVEAAGYRTRARGTTDANGRYLLKGIAPEELSVLASVGDDPEDISGEVIQAGAGRNRLDLILEVRIRHEIHGRVVDSRGAPVEGAVIVAHEGEIDFRDQVSKTDGSFHGRAQDGGPYVLLAMKEGFRSVPGSLFTVAGTDVNGLVLRLEIGGSVTGRILGLSPEELADAKVEGSPVDAQGSYRITGLTSGTIWVEATTGFRSVRDTVELKPGQEEAVLDLTFPPARNIQGRVVGPLGEPLEALVYFNGLSVHTRHDGTFSARLADGFYSYVTEAPGYRRAWGLLTVGNDLEEELEIQMERSRVISGRVLGLAPGDVAEIQLQHRGSAGYLHQTTDQDGRFQFEDLESGEWTVTAVVRLPPKFEDREVKELVNIPPGNEEVTIELDFKRAVGPADPDPGDPEKN